MTHLCHAVGCHKAVAPKMLMCLDHWRMVPRPAQNIIWHHYRPGQEITKDPTPEYLLAQACAVALVAFKDKQWGARKAGNHIAVASKCAEIDGVALGRREETIRAMGCDKIFA